MCQAVHIMKRLNVIGVIVAVTIVALAGIAMVAAAAASLLVQSASATGQMTTSTLEGEEQEESVISTNTTTNNVSNAVLGRLFQIVEFGTANINPVNETYIEI